MPAATDLLADARRALLDDRRQLTLGELAALAALPDAEVWALAAVAHDVRLAWCGDVVEVEGILAAKTGGCPEDCQFCSRSALRLAGEARPVASPTPDPPLQPQPRDRPVALPRHWLSRVI